jgi:tRNA (guanine26-N2/guanine27-N2)-dimethyltransferase
MDTITEGSAKIKISQEKKISRKLEVFYNPVMKLNRDISVLLLNSIEKTAMQIADPLSGTGIRGIRFIKELLPGKLKNISFNDHMTESYIKDNLRLNGLRENDSTFIFTKDANLFLLESSGFDYIDLDPFGTPNPFIESSIIRLSRDGVLAVTATDTSALSGSFPASCRRKYWAKPMRNELMHEIGIRILIRRVQLTGAIYDKSLMPIFSYSKDHYFRVFFTCSKGREKVDNLLKSHNYFLYNKKTMEMKISKYNCLDGFDYAGPLFTGNLWDEKLASAMHKNCDKENKLMHSLLDIIKEEAKIDSVGFYDLQRLANAYGKQVPRLESVLKEGITTRTHFLGWGIRTEIKPEKIII